MDQDHVDHLTAQWAHERPDLDTSALALAARVVRLERFLVRLSAQGLATFDLSEGETNVLAALRRSGPPYRLTPTELYRGLLVSSGAMTNRLDGLEEAGLVRREQDPDDRRRILVALTDTGRDVIDRAMDAHTTDLVARFAFLGDDERDQLCSLLRRVLVELEADAAEAPRRSDGAAPRG